MTTETKDRVTEVKEYRQRMMDKLNMDTSTVETYVNEKDKNTYIAKLESKVDEMKSQLDQLTDKSKDLEKDVRAEFEKEKANLERRRIALKTKLDEVRNSGEEAWKDFHEGVVSAWNDLTDGFKNALSKFR